MNCKPVIKGCLWEKFYGLGLIVIKNTGHA